MIAVPAGSRVLVATKPVDFRKGAEGLIVTGTRPPPRHRANDLRYSLA